MSKLFAMFAGLCVALAAAKEARIRSGPPGELPEVLHTRNQQATGSSMETYAGNTRFRPRFFRPEATADGLCVDQEGDDEDHYRTRWSATGFEVSQTGEYSILSAQRFDGAIFLYKDVFVPGAESAGCIYGNDESADYPFDNGISYSALDNVELERGKRYILVTTGMENGERGRFQNYIWGPAGSQITIEEKGCAQVGCDEDSFTETCACDSECVTLCDCCYDYCDECAEADLDGLYVDTCGNVQGDPHYYGFTGEFFNVKGEVGKIYNLLTDANVNVNAKYDFGCKPDTTVLSELGIVYESHEIKFDIMGAHQVNGEDMTEGQKIWLNEERSAWAERLVSEGGLRVVTPEYTLTGKSTESKCGLAHLDVKVQTRNPNSAPHGLLGQTKNAMRTRSAPEAGMVEQGAGFIEGVYTEYEVPHLFTKEHAYSRFGKIAVPEKVASKRQ